MKNYGCIILFVVCVTQIKCCHATLLSHEAKSPKITVTLNKKIIFSHQRHMFVIILRSLIYIIYLSISELGLSTVSFLFIGCQCSCNQMHPETLNFFFIRPMEMNFIHYTTQYTYLSLPCVAGE